MSLKRRRTDPDATTSKEEEEDESDGPNRRSSTIKKKRSCANAFIVISDSDGETQKEENESQITKNKLSTARSKLEAKRRIAQMTEEEQLELAVRMSEQEASQVNCRQETEAELLKKAIAESLTSKQSSKVIGRSKARLKLAPKVLKPMCQTEEEEDFNCSQTTCPDSQPLLDEHSQVSMGKSNLIRDCRAGTVSPNKKPTSAPLSGSCSLSPIRKSASQLLDRASCVSPVGKPDPQTPSKANYASPVALQQLCGASCVTPIKKPASQLLAGAGTLSPSRKPCSQPLEEADQSLRASKPFSESLNGASCPLPERLDGACCASPTRISGSPSLSGANSASSLRTSASQPLSGVSRLLSPIRKPASQPVGEAISCSLPVGKPMLQPLSGSSYPSPVRKSSSQPQTELELSSPARKCASDSPNGGAKSPVVVLERLSQDIVESSSVVLSLAGSPFSSALTDNSDFVPNSPLKHPYAISPTFPRRSPCASQLAPRRLLSTLATGQGAVTKAGEKRPLDGAESSSGSSTPEHLLDLEADGILGKVACSPADIKKDTKCNGTCHETLVSQETCPKVSGTVHYYWGVPFCPKGVDPSQYSKVILCQLEVYQKSLKQAQRQLLHKMEFGPPILPRPPSSRRNNRSKADEEVQEIPWGGLSPREDPLSENSRESSASLAAEERTAAAEDGPTTSYSQSQCVVETPNGSDSQADAREDEPMKDIPRAPALRCSDVQGKPEGSGTQEEEEVTVCPETLPSLFSDSEPERTNPPSAENSPQSQSEHVALAEENDTLELHTPEIEAVVANMDPSVSDIELNGTNVQPTVADVQCPLCGREFAPEQIEHHAADCDGNAVPSEKKQVGPVTTRRQRGMKHTAQDVEALLSLAHSGNRRKSLNESPHTLHFPASGKCEKCYLCKEVVPLREYKGHVENCLQAANLEANKSPTLRSAKTIPLKRKTAIPLDNLQGKNTGRGDGRLLSMLDQSESTSVAAGSLTGAPGARAQRLHLHERGEEQDQMTHSLTEPNSPDDFSSPLPFSNSPIKSFVSISEATDCLVDFKKQFTKEPGRGRSRLQGRGTNKRQRTRGWRGKRR